jgi:hypothetical protein
MPLKSKAQRRWMRATHPEMAKRWEKETHGDLPEKAKHTKYPPPPKGGHK